VISNTQGATLHNSYAATSMTATSLDVAAAPFNGAYSGTFSGTQFFSGGNSCPITGALDLTASGTTITTTAPATGSGTLNDSSGVASFTIAALADPNATCTFNGTFAVDTSGAVTASGTWSCSVSGTSASGFTSANGTWSLSRQ